MRSGTRAALVAAGFVAAGLIAGCAAPQRRTVIADPPLYPYVRMDTTMGEIVVRLESQAAPITVANFLHYVDAGAYDGTIFHRVVPTFVIQGGGWTPDLKERAKEAAAAGRPDTPIKNEWRPDGLKNSRGTIAMARDTGPDTATREFYINLVDNAKLDSAREKTGNAGYAVFGEVVKGIDVVDRIARVPNHAVQVEGVSDGSMENVPVEVVVIRKVERMEK